MAWVQFFANSYWYGWTGWRSLSPDLRYFIQETTAPQIIPPHSPPPSSFYFSACVCFLALKPQILINRRFEQGCLVINTVLKKKRKRRRRPVCSGWLPTAQKCERKKNGINDGIRDGGWWWKALGNVDRTRQGACVFSFFFFKKGCTVVCGESGSSTRWGVRLGAPSLTHWHNGTLCGGAEEC